MNSNIDTADVQKAAAALFAAFTTGTRDDGATFYYLADGSPEWMTAAVFAAHDAVDELPDDRVYGSCRAAAACIADNDDDDHDDGASDWADSQVSVYSASRVAWLAEKPLIRGPLCDEAVEELGRAFDGGIFECCALGWYEWERRIYCAILDGCREQAEADDAEGEA